MDRKALIVLIVALSSLALLTVLQLNQHASAPQPSPTISPTILLPSGPEPALLKLSENVSAPENLTATLTTTPAARIDTATPLARVEASPSASPTPSLMPSPSGMTPWGPVSPMPPMQAWSPLPEASPLSWNSTLF